LTDSQQSLGDAPTMSGALVPTRLAELETRIERGLQTFIEVGEALAEIRDQRLYRESHATFEAYCRERWGWSRQHAYRQIKAAQMVGTLSPMGDKPANERQARALLAGTRESRPTAGKYAVYPDLDAKTEAALRASIDRFGVLVPVVKDQHGNILDGHQRARIADSLGIKYPVNIIEVADEDEAREIVHTMNEDRWRPSAHESRYERLNREIHEARDEMEQVVERLAGFDPAWIVNSGRLADVTALLDDMSTSICREATRTKADNLKRELLAVAQ